ncbi:hypothetical protein THAOC_03082, partial [Thalassiosira oceanica]
PDHPKIQPSKAYAAAPNMSVCNGRSPFHVTCHNMAGRGAPRPWVAKNDVRRTPARRSSRSDNRKPKKLANECNDSERMRPRRRAGAGAANRHTTPHCGTQAELAASAGAAGPTGDGRERAEASSVDTTLQKEFGVLTTLQGLRKPCVRPPSYLEHFGAH